MREILEKNNSATINIKEACLKQRIPATTTDERHMSKQRISETDKTHV
jgi:hypothetical protein